MGHISFIIPVYNAEATLLETIISLYNDNFYEGDEVIIIDDASEDGTYPLALELQKKYPGIKIIRHAINKGSAAAGRNTGIDQAQHELIFCLDADNLLLQGSIKKLQQYMIETGSDCSAFGEIHFFEKDPSVLTKTWVLNENISFISAINEMTKAPCSSGNYLFTKTSWKKAGRYNESVGGAYDSFAFGLAQIATGSKMNTLKGTAYLHRIGYESTSLREFHKRETSLLFLQILLPFINRIHPEDIDYIMGEGRSYWFEQLAYRPLRLADEKSNPALSYQSLPEPPLRELLKIVGRKIRRKIKGK
jgi:glycosyltransferase involved in cell wall biosynthesis